MPFIKAKLNTKIKTKAIDSMKLGPKDVSPIPKGQQLAVVSCEGIEAGHSRISFSGRLTIDKHPWETAIIYNQHWEGLEAFRKADIAAVSNYSASGSGDFIIPVPYQCQIGNDTNLFGADWRQCFLTSVSGSIRVILGETEIAKRVKAAGAKDWESVYAKILYKYGDTTDSGAHVKALASMGIEARFRTDGNLEKLKAILKKGVPVPIGVAWSGSGHWMYAVGFDTDGNIIINDVYGKRDLSSSGLMGGVDRYVSIGSGGEHNRYTPQNMAMCWTDQGPNTGWFLEIVGTPKGGKPAPATAPVKQKPVTLHATKNTYVKMSPVQSGELSDQRKQLYKSGDKISGIPDGIEAGHLRLNVNSDDWYLFLDHWKSEAKLPSSSTGGPRLYQPSEWRLNSIATEMIKSYEGLELRAYVCAAGVVTIGLGTTRYPNSSPVRMGDTCTETEALEYFKHDTQKFIDCLKTHTKKPLTGKQIAALVGFCYNVGRGAYQESTLLKVINSGGDVPSVQAQLRRWTNKGTPAEPGLRKRRESECELWAGGDWRRYR